MKKAGFIAAALIALAVGVAQPGRADSPYFYIEATPPYSEGFHSDDCNATAAATCSAVAASDATRGALSVSVAAEVHRGDVFGSATAEGQATLVLKRRLPAADSDVVISASSSPYVATQSGSGTGPGTSWDHTLRIDVDHDRCGTCEVVRLGPDAVVLSNDGRIVAGEITVTVTLSARAVVEETVHTESRSARTDVATIVDRVSFQEDDMWMWG